MVPDDDQMVDITVSIPGSDVKMLLALARWHGIDTDTAIRQAVATYTIVNSFLKSGGSVDLMMPHGKVGEIHYPTWGQGFENGKS